MSKTTNFETTVTNTVNNLDVVAVKEALGDSTNNNRTLSVRRLIRFLSATRGRNAARNRALASNIEAVYGKLRSSINTFRSEGRTDAIDVQEFLSELNLTVAGDARTIARVISS